MQNKVAQYKRFCKSVAWMQGCLVHACKNGIKFFCLVIILFFTYLLLSTKAQAQTQNTTQIIVVPPKQELILEPGTTSRITVRFYNESDEPILADLKIADFIVTSEQGSPDFLENYTTDKAYRYAASSWVNLPYKSVTIPAKDRIEAIATINVPKNALPGGHYFAIILEPKSETGLAKTSLEAAQSISARVASLANIIVPGNYLTKATISRLFAPLFSEYGPVKTEVRLKNTGDIHIRPKAYLQLSDFFGKSVDSKTLKEVNIFPAAERNYSGELGRKLMFGRYQISLTATYGQGQVVSGKLYVWVIPWKLITVLVLTIIIIWIIVKRTTTVSKQKVIQLEQQLKKEEDEIEKLKKMLKKRGE